MATTPTLQPVLLFQHHQTTMPNLPHTGPGGGLGQAQGTLGRPIPAEEAPAPEKVAMASPKKEEKTETAPPFDTVEDDEENESEAEEENGEEHQ